MDSYLIDSVRVLQLVLFRCVLEMTISCMPYVSITTFGPVENNRVSKMEENRHVKERRCAE